MPIWAIKIGAGVLLVAALTGGYFAWASRQQGIGEKRATVAFNVKIEAQKKEALAVLVKETARVATAERALHDFKNRQEVKDAGNKKTADNLTARLRALAGNSGRLRDPYAGGRQGSGVTSSTVTTGPGNRADNGAETSGLFSAEFSQFLQQKLIEADAINNAYISCREDAEAMRARNGR